MMRIIFIWLFLLLASSSVLSQDQKELESIKVSTQREIQLAKELLNKTSSQKKSSLQRVSILNRGIKSREGLISAYESEIELLDESILDLEKQIKQINDDIEKGKAEYAKIVFAIYKNHTEEEKLMYLLASKSINQFYQRVKYLKYLTNYREKKIEELKLLILNLDEKKTSLLQTKNEKLLLLTEKENENKILLREKNVKRGMIRELTQNEKRIRKEIQEKEKIRLELEAKIRKAIEEAERKRGNTGLYSSLTPEQKLISENFDLNKSRLPWPVDRGIITARFGTINSVVAGVKIKNNGIDFSTVANTKARAIFDGEVTEVFAILGANFAVIVMHGDYRTVYQNLVDVKVKVGDKVLTKQELGTIHADGNISVLHFEVWKSRSILNPENWISPQM